MQPFDILPTYPPRPTYSIAPVPTPLGFQGGGWFTGAVGATSYPASFNPAPFNGQGSSSECAAISPTALVFSLISGFVPFSGRMRCLQQL